MMLFSKLTAERKSSEPLEKEKTVPSDFDLEVTRSEISEETEMTVTRTDKVSEQNCSDEGTEGDKTNVNSTKKTEQLSFQKPILATENGNK